MKNESAVRINSFRNRLCRKHFAYSAGGSIIASLLCGQAAYAQTTDDAEAAGLGDQIVITGSRIKKEGFDAPTPTTMIGGDMLENIGAVNVADAVNIIPSFVPTLTQESSNLDLRGPGNFFNLRGLGVSRTLTLVNGRRHVPSTTSAALNTNVIPSVLIERIEVVTGGASAAWGSDAVAGVANIIFKNDFVGVKGDFQAGISQEGDSEEYRGALAVGQEFHDGRGHFQVAAEFSKNNGVKFQRDRDWGARDWGLVTNGAYVPGNGQFQRTLLPDTRLGIATTGGLILSGSLEGQHFGTNGQLLPFDPGSNPYELRTQGGDGAHWGPFAPLSVPLERFNSFSTASYEITENVSIFAEVSFARQSAHNENLIENFSLGDIFINADNAYLPTGAASQLAANNEAGFVLGRLHTDFGFLQGRDRTKTLRFVTGLNGALGGDWAWEAYYQFGKTDGRNRGVGNLILSNFEMATDAVRDPGSGDIVCRSTLIDPGDGCVPINLFGTGAPSAQAIDYVTGDYFLNTDIKQHVAAVSINGQPFDLWAGPVYTAFGGEYRKEINKEAVDDISLSDGFLFSNPKPAIGTIDVWEGFAEVLVPLMRDSALGRAIDLNAAARLTKYSTSGTVVTWKTGATYDPIDSFRVRVAVSRDIRAPNVDELFDRGGLEFNNIVDPVTNTTVFVGSPTLPNPNLQPEKSDTFTAGIVFSPDWADGLRLSVDYFNITLNGVVASISAQNILDRCVAGAASLCGFVERDPTTNVITRIVQSQLNLQQFKTSGLDFELDYRLPLQAVSNRDIGDLSLRVLATYTDELSIDDGEVFADQAGSLTPLSSAISAAPNWRGLASLNYVNGPISFYNQVRYVGPAARDNFSTDDEVFPNRVKAQAYWSASLTYRIMGRDSDSLDLYLNVNNVLNTAPPILGTDFIVPEATNSTFYDVIGRSFSVGARFGF